MKNPAVDALITQLKRWNNEISYLRDLALTTGLEETIKWGLPTYMLNGNNVFILADFKEYFTINYFKGILLQDPHQVLTTHGNDQQSSRVIKMSSLEQVKSLESIILSYMKEAIENERKGTKVEKKNPEENIKLPEELLEVFKDNRELETAFNRLTPGRRRAYCIYFAGAKQSQTRYDRITKCIDQIMDGKGLND